MLLGGIPLSHASYIDMHVHVLGADSSPLASAEVHLFNSTGHYVAITDPNGWACFYRVTGGEIVTLCVRWQGSYVYGNATQKAEEKVEVRCKVSRIDVSFQDWNGTTSLFPVEFWVEAPNGTRCRLTTVRFRGQNGTWTIHRIMWSDPAAGPTNVVPEVHPSMEIEGTKPDYKWAVRCRVYPFTFMARSLDGDRIGEVITCDGKAYYEPDVTVYWANETTHLVHVDDHEETEYRAVFVRWSDGVEARDRGFLVNATGETYTALYQEQWWFCVGSMGIPRIGCSATVFLNGTEIGELNDGSPVCFWVDEDKNQTISVEERVEFRPGIYYRFDHWGAPLAGLTENTFVTNVSGPKAWRSIIAVFVMDFESVLVDVDVPTVALAGETIPIRVIMCDLTGTLINASTVHVIVRDASGAAFVDAILGPEHLVETGVYQYELSLPTGSVSLGHWLVQAYCTASAVTGYGEEYFKLVGGPFDLGVSISKASTPQSTGVILISNNGCLLYTSPSPRDRG